MRAGARNLIGAVTSLLWLVVGAFILLGAQTTTWLVAGTVVLAIGLLRAVLLVATWRRSGSAAGEQDEE